MNLNTWQGARASGFPERAALSTGLCLMVPLETRVVYSVAY